MKHDYTGEECKGGQIWTECYGHCIARCDNPDPACSRECMPGCNCPVENNVWDGEQCIVAEFCPTDIGGSNYVKMLDIRNTVNTVSTSQISSEQLA